MVVGWDNCLLCVCVWCGVMVFRVVWWCGWLGCDRFWIFIVVVVRCCCVNVDRLRCCLLDCWWTLRLDRMVNDDGRTVGLPAYLLPTYLLPAAMPASLYTYIYLLYHACLYACLLLLLLLIPLTHQLFSPSHALTKQMKQCIR